MWFILSFSFLCVCTLMRGLYHNKFLTVPLLLVWIFLVHCCYNAQHVHNGTDSTNTNILYTHDWYSTCKRMVSFDDYVPKMVIGMLPSFLVVFYLSQSISRFFHSYTCVFGAMSHMSDFWLMLHGSFSNQPHLQMELFRLFNLANLLFFSELSPSVYSWSGFVLPLAQCFGHLEHGLLSQKEKEFFDARLLPIGCNACRLPLGIMINRLSHHAKKGLITREEHIKCVDIVMQYRAKISGIMMIFCSD